MASEISGLADLHGYLKKGNLVVRLRFPFIELPAKQPKFIERQMQKQVPKLLTTATDATDAVAEEQKLIPHEVRQDREYQLKRTSPIQEHYFE